jgi:hypothetical protein
MIQRESESERKHLFDQYFICLRNTKDVPPTTSINIQKYRTAALLGFDFFFGEDSFQSFLFFWQK